MLTVYNNGCGIIRRENIKTIKMRVHTSMRQLKKRIKKKNNSRGTWLYFADIYLTQLLKLSLTP